MPKLSLDEIIEKGERIVETSEDKLIRSILSAEPIIYDELMKLFDSIDVTSGKIQNSTKAQQFLAKLEEKIFGALKKAGYSDAVTGYLKNYDLMSRNIIEVQDALNGQRITASQIEPIKKIEIENTISRLNESGLYKDFIQPIKESLYRNILTGSTITETQKFIKNFVTSTSEGDSRLMRYVKQVSRDSISQFDGNVQANIAKELNLNAKRYVGSLLKDSRAQCVKWVTQNNGIIMLDDLKEEITWALKNGTFTFRGQQLRASGMNADTTVATFDIYRGGYNCRHRSLPTYVAKKI